MSAPHKIDRDATARVDAMVHKVRAAGLDEVADLFSTVYWGWIRLTSAYVFGHPYVSRPEPGMTPLGALHVVDYTFDHWASLIPGTPKLDDAAVLQDADDDEAWHREEDRRMRRDAGEDLL